MSAGDDRRSPSTARVDIGRARRRRASVWSRRLAVFVVFSMLLVLAAPVGALPKSGSVFPLSWLWSLIRAGQGSAAVATPQQVS